MSNANYIPNEAARTASDYFNSLPIAERTKLAPLLEHCRQQGLAEARDHLDLAVGRIASRIRGIQEAAPLERVETYKPRPRPSARRRPGSGLRWHDRAARSSKHA